MWLLILCGAFAGVIILALGITIWKFGKQIKHCGSKIQDEPCCHGDESDRARSNTDSSTAALVVDDYRNAVLTVNELLPHTHSEESPPPYELAVQMIHESHEELVTNSRSVMYE